VTFQKLALDERLITDGPPETALIPEAHGKRGLDDHVHHDLAHNLLLRDDHSHR